MEKISENRVVEKLSISSTSDANERQLVEASKVLLDKKFDARKDHGSVNAQTTLIDCLSVPRKAKRSYKFDDIITKKSKRSTDKVVLLKSYRNVALPRIYYNKNHKSCNRYHILYNLIVIISAIIVAGFVNENVYASAQVVDTTAASVLSDSSNPISDATPQSSPNGASCFGGLQTFEKISMSTFENPSSASGSSGSFGSGILIQQDDQALTSECVNLCRSQSNCLSFIIDYNKFECKSYATTQQELQREFDEKYHAARSVNNSTLNTTDSGGYQASNSHFQHLLPSASSNYFEKVCLDGVANRNQFNDVCGQGRLWTVERVVDSFLDGYVEKEVTNVNSKDECSKLCIFETQFVCRSADYDQHTRLCRLSKEDRRTQPQAMRYVSGSNRQYLENQCATAGPSSCVYETKKNAGIISMDALKFAQTVQDCQMKCNQEVTFNCRSYSFHQQRCFLSGDDSSSLNSNIVKSPLKQGWQYGEKKCLVELCTKGIFSYEKITGYTLRSSLSTPIDLMMHGSSSLSLTKVGNNLDDLEKLQHESSQTKLRHLLPVYVPRGSNNTSSVVDSMMMMMMSSETSPQYRLGDILHQSESSLRQQRGASNLAITSQCRNSCDLGYLNCPAFTIDYKNNRCQRLDRNSQGRHHELVARDGFAYYEKICLRVPEIMSMCQDKYWIFERVIGYELAPRLYDKTLKFVQSRRDCEEYCLEEKQFQCRSALYNDEISECRLSRYDRRLATQEGGYYRNFNVRISYLENQCIRDHVLEKKQQCFYEQAKEEPSYPTFTEHIEMIPAPTNPTSTLETESNRHPSSNTTVPARFGHSYCEQLCNENAKFECHSFGYYASTAQCFLSGDDSTSAGESATTPSTGFTYFEKKCYLPPGSNNHTTSDDSQKSGATTTTSERPDSKPYFQPTHGSNHFSSTRPSDASFTSTSKPYISNNNISIHIDQQLNMLRPPLKHGSTLDGENDTASLDSDQYKCGYGHTFVYQRISGFEPVGGYLTLLVKNNDQPGIVAECSHLCKKAFECRAFVVDYNSNQCFAMLENSSVGMLSLRQTLGKDYFEGFCIANHILISGSNCRNKTWVMDKIVDQAVIGVQHQKLIPDTDRLQCRQACLEERLFWCKSAMFDGSTGDCKLYSIDRESMPLMRLLFTKGFDFFENQCQITSNTCPYDAIERDMTMITTTKSIQAKSTFDCEYACNIEISFNCRSYTYLDQYPSLPNLCLLSSDSRSTSQKGSIKEQQRALYAERNCYYRRPRYPGGNQRTNSINPFVQPTANSDDTYQPSTNSRPESASDPYGPIRPSDNVGSGIFSAEVGPSLGQGCEPHQYTFERSFGYDYRLGQKERAPIAPTIGIAIACQQECLRRGDKCQSFVVEYALPFQSCFLIDTQVGANKKLLIKSSNSAYFEKVCLPRTGVEVDPTTHSLPLTSNQLEMQSMDIAPSYSHEPWSPQVPNQLPYYQQQQQLVQNYPSRSCAKLWSFERFVNHNFTVASDKVLEETLSKAHCETLCLNEASFSCRAATYDYTNKICRLFKNTRRTIMSQFVDLELSASGSSIAPIALNNSPSMYPGTAHIITGEADSLQLEHSNTGSLVSSESSRRQSSARQLAGTAESTVAGRNIDYLENTCIPEPSSCQYRQLYDLISPYVDKINHAVSLSDCQRQCDLERLFSCKSINYDPSSRSCMLINEDLISLNRGQQGSLLPKKNTIYSEKGNCEMISVQCNSQEMLVSINFDSPFRGRVMAKGNPEQCYKIGDGQVSLQFPIVFGPKCNSRQEGHNNFVNEVVIQQHPVIMTDSDKTVRVMCAFEAPDQTITLKNPSSRDNKTGIDVGAPESSRTRHDKQHFNSVVSNKALPPSVLLRILDQNGRDASMINLGDDLVLRIQMQMDGQNSALGIFARNLAARSSNGESLLLIDNEGCPVDHLVFPALEVDPSDGKSLYSTFKAFRFPSSGLVNFEVQIRFCPERCQPVDCHKGIKSKSYGRKKREISDEGASFRTPVIQSVNIEKSPIEALSTVMKPGKAFQYVRELLLKPQSGGTTNAEQSTNPAPANEFNQEVTVSTSEIPAGQADIEVTKEQGNPSNDRETNEFVVTENTEKLEAPSRGNQYGTPITEAELQGSFQKSILMHVDEKVVPSTGYIHSRSNQPYSPAPYGRYPLQELESQRNHQNVHPYPKSTTNHEFGSDEPKKEKENNSNFSNEDPVLPTQMEPTDSSEQPLNENLDTTHQISPNEVPANMREERIVNETTFSEGASVNSNDVPLRFSILVGENQPSSAGWIPGGPPLVMNSTNVDLDHIVIPGKGGQLETGTTSEARNQFNTDFLLKPESSTSAYSENNYLTSGESKPNNINIDESKRSTLYDQTFDALSSNSIAAEVNINQAPSQENNTIHKIKHHGLPSQSAVRHDCQVESGNSRLWTIIWTGTVIIVLNICLVVLSLVLYFKKVHLRQNHNIMRSTSECESHNINGRSRWPSVLLKSKNNLGTSLNTHEHFFCKLNSKPDGSNLTSGHEFNWPNLSTSSSHSTISSMASPLPVTSIRINQSAQPYQSSIRNNFNTGHKSTLSSIPYDNRSSLHATYINNVDEGD